MRKLNQRGVTLIELLIASAILAALASSVMMARSFVAKQTVRNTDKAYATQKAIQMFEELKALVNGTEKTGVNVLDQYSDGTLYNTVLTTDKTVDTSPPGSGNAADALSGNKKTNSHWRYLRQILINRLANDPYTRQVIVKVWRYASDSDPNDPGELLAEVGGMLSTISTVFPPTQVMDVYVLALSNVLGWFTSVPQMQSIFNQVYTDVQARNPGLEMRVHYITQTGFGRDPYYKPYINTLHGTDIAPAIPYVYLYPGLIQSSDQSYSPYAGAQTFFSSSEMVSMGNMNIDGTATASNYSNYGVNASICDMYNHGLRYPDELADYQAVSQAAVAAGNPAPEITLRMLLEGMNAPAPNSFRNAIILSMHGEVLPLVAMRNYSDPAKDPSGNPNVRIVTHPTNIHYGSASAVTLRVYGYYDGLDDTQSLNATYPDPTGNTTPSLNTATIYLPDLNLSSTQMSVSCIYGGYVGGAAVGYAGQALTAGANDSGGMKMHWTLTNPTATSTLITLFNTPLRCDSVVVGATTTGLPTANRLYGTEYIPCPVESPFANYTPNLATSGAASPKNTARWIIRVNAGAVPDGQHTVETRIGTDLTTGTSANISENLSRTYVWIGVGSGSFQTTGTSASGYTPFTERFQYNGDPRDCPYQDVKFGGSAFAGDPVQIGSDGYNWYFKSISGVDGYSGFPRTTNGYNANSLTTYQDDRDMPRYYYTYRNGLLQSSAIFINLNGYSFWHAAEGGEFGDTYDPFRGSLPFIGTPWNASSNALAVVSEVQTSASYGAGGYSGNTEYDNTTFTTGPTYKGSMDVIRDDSTVPTLVSRWFARSWRGELFPDDDFSSYWQPQGNLPTGVGKFYRVPYGAVTTNPASSINGFDNGRTYQKQIGAWACAAFMDGNSDGSVGTANGFMHTTGGTNQLSGLIGVGADLYNIFTVPLADPVSCTRPWTSNITMGANVPADWSSTFYSGIRTKLSIPMVASDSVSRVFYSSQAIGLPAANSSWNGVGALEMDQGGQTAFFNISGLAPQANFGTNNLAKAALIAGLRTFLDGGNYTGSAHITQIPLVKIYTDSLTGQYSQPASIQLALDSPVTTGTSLVLNANFTIPSGPTANVWYRFQGVTSSVANFYTEEYPGYSSNLLNSTYSDSVNFDVNIKYSTDGGKTYKFIQDGVAATLGVLDSSAAHLINVTAIPYIYDWNVSDANTYPQGDYWVRAEVYRHGYPLHYAYHTIDISIDR